MKASTPVLARLASNTSWLLLERGISLAIAIGVGLYFVRYLGPDDFGAYSYALALYGLFSAASKLGINALVVNETVLAGARHSTILGSAFMLRMTASVAGVLLLNLTAYALGDGEFSRRITFVFSLALLFGPFETITHWFEANVHMRPIAVARSSTSILIGLSRLALIVQGYGLFWFVWLAPIEGALASMMFLVVYRSQGYRLWDWKPDVGVMKRFIREGAPLFFSALAVVTYMKIDQVMLEKMTSAREVGIYSAAVRISEMFYFVPVILGGVLFPYLIKAGKRGEPLFRQTLQVTCDGFAWIALLIAAPVTLFSVPLVTLAYGADYLPSAEILVIHVWAALFIFLEVPRIRWLIIRNRTHFQLLTTAIGAVCNILLNFIWIPRYGGYGAALATLVSYGLAIVFSCFLHSQTREIGVMLLKAMVAPIRIAETLRVYGHVKAAVDERASRGAS
jgi:O-antigen/teichoic acid export membrane protein